MATHQNQANKARFLQAFDTLFNRRDYVAAENFWSPAYIQHSAHLAPGRAGLFDRVRIAPPTLKYENQFVVADGDIVIAYGRFSGLGLPASWIVADVFIMKDGVFTEHWDLIEDEATQQQSKSGRPMFGDSFPA